MMALILAAGTGSRLLPLTRSLPKALIEVGGSTLIERSIRIVRKHGIDEIVIAVGFEAEQIIRRLGARSQGVNIRYVVNPRYSETGSMYSFSQTKHLLDRDLLLLESDLLFEEGAIARLLKDPRENLMLAVEPPLSGDEVFICSDSQGRLKNLGKDISKDREGQIQGCFAGISKLGTRFLERLFEVAEQDFSGGELNRHYEDCILRASSPENPAHVMFCRDLCWCEVDTEDDLQQALRVVLPRLPARQRQNSE